MFKKFSLFLFVLMPFFAKSQAFIDKTDSINVVLNKLNKQPNSFKNDTLKVLTIIQKSINEQNFATSTKSIATANEAEKLARKINWKKGIVKALYFKAEGYQLKSQYYSVIQESLKVLALIKKEEFPFEYIVSTRMVAASYMLMEKPSMAKKYYDELMKIMNQKYISRNTYYDIYTDVGALYGKFLNQPKTALTYLQKAMSGYTPMHDTLGIGYASSYLGIVYHKLGKNKEAEKALNLAVNYYRKTKSYNLLGDGLNYSAEFYNDMGNHQLAISLAKEAEKYGSDLNNFWVKRDANRNLYKAYKANDDFKNALKYYENFANARDSMSQANIDDRLKVVRYDYDTQIQKAKIAEIGKEKQLQALKIKSQLYWLYVLIASLLAVFILAYLYFKNNEKEKAINKQKIKELEQETQIVAMSSIMQGQEAERGRMAKDLHDGLGGMLSGIKLNLWSMKGNQIIQEKDNNIFNNSINQLETAIKELRRVAHNLMPEALLKFGLAEAIEDFCVNINQSGAINLQFFNLGNTFPMDKSLQVILYRIVQELTNNALKYANAKNIIIQIQNHENGLNLTVEDDGQGFDIRLLENQNGAGLENVKSRVNYLKGKFTIFSEIAKGTTCTIEIPSEI